MGIPYIETLLDSCQSNHTDLTAICPGRTVIESDNSYKTEIAPMAERSQLVQHCILSLAATYMLDFARDDPLLKAKANYHQKSAVEMLGLELSRMEVQSPGKEEGVIAALLLLAHNEVRLSSAEL